MNAAQIGQAQGCSHLLDESSLLAHGIHAVHIDLRAADGKHHTGQTTAGAHIQQRQALALFLRQAVHMPQQGGYGG